MSAVNVDLTTPLNHENPFGAKTVGTGSCTRSEQSEWYSSKPDKQPSLLRDEIRG
ncbi:hypothetical protein PhCBS80983_g03833 [Powellomyces hirtus]|uniref:Uncharacterized protein n=1 Tax=Powellomyces hirtus TaxID=109895 RepID=A0A507E2A6_9FUNG|nr:hypothetical protein PhCBS80983_g03833 [Powellomyces hirtus]